MFKFLEIDLTLFKANYLYFVGHQVVGLLLPNCITPFSDIIKFNYLKVMPVYFDDNNFLFNRDGQRYYSARTRKTK